MPHTAHEPGPAEPTENDPEPTETMTQSSPVEQTETAPPYEAEHDDETAGESGGWLATLRSHLGLQDSRSLRDMLEQALSEQSEGADAFTNQERDILLRTLRFGALRVEDVMVPRADIVSADEQTTVAELLRIFEAAGHSRIPVYRDTLDDLRGMIHIKDLVAWIAKSPGMPPADAVNGEAADATATGGNGTGDANGTGNSAAPIPAGESLNLGELDLTRPVAELKIKRELLFVPPSMPAVNLLLRMQSTHQHLAMVIDEYGGTDGLVSIEDLVEEIVGDIEDEHDENGGDLIVQDPKLGLVAAARTPIEDLVAYLGIEAIDGDDAEDADTLGGLVFSLAGHVPVRGELVRHPGGLEFEVLEADPRRIKRLRVHLREPSGDGGEEE